MLLFFHSLRFTWYRITNVHDQAAFSFVRRRTRRPTFCVSLLSFFHLRFHSRTRSLLVSLCCWFFPNLNLFSNPFSVFYLFHISFTGVDYVLRPPILPIWCRAHPKLLQKSQHDFDAFKWRRSPTTSSRRRIQLIIIIIMIITIIHSNGSSSCKQWRSSISSDISHRALTHK